MVGLPRIIATIRRWKAIISLSRWQLCHNERRDMFVILNPSLFVTLSEAKGLGFWLRINSVKNFIESIG
jgi:hypothetical protein